MEICDKCPAGYGLVSMCNSTQRTVCQPCTLGITYSALEPHFKPCTPCSKCGENMYEDVSCTTFSDTFCDSCSTQRGFLNEDYLIKCKRDPNAIDKFEFDSSEFDKELIDDLDDFNVKKYVKVFRETDNELDHVSKEDEKPDDFDEQMKRVFGDINEELDEDDRLDLFNINDTRFENDIDDSVKLVKQEKEDKSSDEDDFWKPIPFTPSPDDDKSPEYESIDNPENNIDIDNSQLKKDMVYKPSDHGYPYEDLLHPDYFRYKQIRKVVWLYGITAIMLMMAIMFLTCYAGSYYRRRRAYISVQLTEQDNQIIRDCALRLERTENSSDNKRRNPFVNSNENGLQIVENPLEEYLDDQAFNGSTESLIPNVHKGQKLEIV